MERTKGLIEKAVTWGRYQIVISTCIILTSLSQSYMILVLPFMYKTPEFKINNGLRLYILPTRQNFVQMKLDLIHIKIQHTNWF